MRGGFVRKERLAREIADALVLTVLYPHLRWDLDADRETAEHRRLRATVRVGH